MLSNTDFPEHRFAPQTRLFLSHPSLLEPISVVVKRSRPHKNLFLVQFEEWNHIDEVEQWRNAELWVPMTEAVFSSLEKDEYYFHQIIGCSVQTTDGQNLGNVKEILRYPANDVWVVEASETGKEILLPGVKEVIREVDLKNRKITIVWMEGLESS